MSMRSSGKIDAFERSLGRYDQFEALGTPSVVCARGRMPRGRAEADCASGPVGLSRLPRGRVRARKRALLELSRRPEVERKGGESAYCRTHGRATYENSGCGTGAAARAGSGESFRSSGSFCRSRGTGGGVKGEDGARERGFSRLDQGFQSQTTRATLKTALKTAKNPNKNRPNGIF